MARYFVEFDFKQKVTGFVEAKSIKDAKNKVLGDYNNPDFDGMIEHNMSSLADIEFEACYRSEE